MAKKPKADPNALLCNTCDKQVEQDEQGDLVHKNQNVKDHEVIKTIKYSDWAAKIAALRVIPGRKAAKAGKKGTRAAADKTTDARPGPKPAEAEKIKPKSLAQRNRRYKRADMGIDAWTKEQTEKKAALDAKKAEAERTLPDLYWHKTKGLHYPNANSTTPVVNPTTREIIEPKSGRVMGKFTGVIPTDTSKPSDIAGQEHIDTHPEHAWETAVDIRSIEKTGKATPLIGPGPDEDASRSGPSHAFFGQMVDWAREHKKLFDQADRYEYTLTRPTLTLATDAKNRVFTQQDAVQNPNTWMVKRRLKFCADCAPQVLDPGTGKMVRNRTQSVTRPAPLELPSVTSRRQGGKDDTVIAQRGQLGLINKDKPGPIPASIAPRAPQTDGFLKGSGEGKTTGAE
jgi:hypothetical protein